MKRVVVVAASEASPVVQAAAMLAVVVVLGLSVAFLASRSRARSRDRRERRERAIARLPEEYRPPVAQLRRWSAGFLAASAAVAVVRELVSGEAAIALAWLTFVPGAVVLLRRAAARERRIVAAVRARAGELEEEQLSRLVADLEEVYGRRIDPLRTPARAE